MSITFTASYKYRKSGQSTWVKTNGTFTIKQQNEREAIKKIEDYHRAEVELIEIKWK